MNPKIRQSVYFVGTIIPAILGLFLLWGGITKESADSVASIVAGLVSLFGAAAPATAAVKVGQQRKDGTFTSVSPADSVANGVQAYIEQQAAAASEFDKITKVITGAVGQIPGFGPLAQQVIQLGVQ